MDSKKRTRRTILQYLPFALPLSTISIDFEKKAMAQGDSAALIPWLEKGLEHYQKFSEQFDKVKGEISKYNNAYNDIKKQYESLQRQVEKEVSKLNTFHDIHKNPLGVELPDLPGIVNDVFRRYNAITKKYTPEILKVRKKYPKKPHEVMTPKEVKFHRSREAHARHALGKAEMANLKDKTQKLKKTVADSVKSAKDKEKTVAETFGKESSHISVDQTHSIGETLLRIEALLIKMSDKLDGVNPEPVEFSDRQWIEVLKAFKKGKGTLTESENS